MGREQQTWYLVPRVVWSAARPGPLLRGRRGRRATPWGSHCAASGHGRRRLRGHRSAPLGRQRRVPPVRPCHGQRHCCRGRRNRTPEASAPCASRAASDFVGSCLGMLSCTAGILSDSYTTTCRTHHVNIINI
jgi:hypothetical protein